MSPVSELTTDDMREVFADAWANAWAALEQDWHLLKIRALRACDAADEDAPVRVNEYLNRLPEGRRAEALLTIGLHARGRQFWQIAACWWAVGDADPKSLGAWTAIVATRMAEAEAMETVH